MRTVKAYIYSRVSSLQQVDAFGLERQISTVLDFLENAKLPAELGISLIQAIMKYWKVIKACQATPDTTSRRAHWGGSRNV